MRRQHVMSEGLWSMQVEVPYPKAIRCGEMVFTCGQCDLDADGKPLRPGDLLAQTERTMDYAYGVIARLALLAAAIELERTDPQGMRAEG